jgi:hypothetical protein
MIKFYHLLVTEQDVDSPDSFRRSFCMYDKEQCVRAGLNFVLESLRVRFEGERDVARGRIVDTCQEQMYGDANYYAHRDIARAENDLAALSREYEEKMAELLGLAVIPDYKPPELLCESSWCWRGLYLFELSLPALASNEE